MERKTTKTSKVRLPNGKRIDCPKPGKVVWATDKDGFLAGFVVPREAR